MPDLSKRNRLPEWMDQPDIDPALHLHALKGLSRLNYFSNSVSLLWKPLRSLALANPHDFSVLDVATGSGDIPLGLSKKATQAGINIKFRVTDKSAFALNLVREKAQQYNKSRNPEACPVFRIAHMLPGGPAVASLTGRAPRSRRSGPSG